MSNARFRGGRQRAMVGPPVASPLIGAPVGDGKWVIRWRRVGLALCGLLLLVVAGVAPLFLQACMATREAPINDKASGAPLYVGEDGRATTEPVNPVTGQPRERATVPQSTGQTEAMIEGAQSLTGMLPGPFGFIADAVLGVGAIAGGLAYRIQRRRRLEELGLTEELITIADENETTRRKLTENPNPKVREKVAQVRRKRALPSPA